jgi:hypothetical protein
MGNFTETQRKEIYAAAHGIMAACRFDKNQETTDDGNYACHAVAMAVDEVLGAGAEPALDNFEAVVTEENFPELFLFLCEAMGNTWLGDDTDGIMRAISPYTRAGNELRQTVLALCHEMCED